MTGQCATKVEGVIIIADTESALAIKIVSAFFVGILIIYVTARFTGSENKAKWFKKRQRMSFFNMRSVLGESWHFGYPRTWQGLVVVLLMYGIIGLVGYEIIFGF